MRGQRALVVEDDASVGEAVKLTLEREGMVVEVVGDGTKGLEAAQRDEFDVVVLDVMLPGLDGLTVCRELRATSRVPIVMLSARGDPTDVVVGLELGADDYLSKPFHPRELVARLRAALRRAAPDEDEPASMTVGDLRLDVEGQRAWSGDEELTLTSTEFRLLAELVRHRGRVLSREDLLQEVWGYDYLGDSRLVDMAVRRLRSKLDDDPREPRYITTVRGAGYRFDG